MSIPSRIKANSIGNLTINIERQTLNIGGNQLSPKTSALAIWSLVLGVLSLFCLSIFAAIPGAICGHKALSQIKKSGGALAGNGLAIGGLVTSYLGILWAIVLIPMLIAIPVPNFIKGRDIALRSACIQNLRHKSAATLL
jgi:hypothetical protein